MTILFLVLWGLLFGAALFAIAATPTTVHTPNSALVAPLFVTGAISGLVMLCVTGFLSLFF